MCLSLHTPSSEARCDQKSDVLLAATPLMLLQCFVLAGPQAKITWALLSTLGWSRQTTTCPTMQPNDVLHEAGPEWTLLHLPCSCHKVHKAAQKTWALESGIVRGMSRVGLVFRTGGNQRVQTELGTAYVRRFMRVIEPEPLGPEAVLYRDQILRFFTPESSRGASARRTLVCFAEHLNGDWRREDGIFHLCRGESCCKDFEDTVQKTLWLFSLLLQSAVQPCVLNRGNWLAWQKAWPFFGVFGVHGVLKAVFHLTFDNQPGKQQTDVYKAHVEDNDVNEDADKMEQLRRAVSENKRVAMEFLDLSPSLDCLLLRAALDPQILLIHRIASFSSPEFEISELASITTTQSRGFPVLQLASGLLFKEFFDAVHTNRTDQGIWLEFEPHKKMANRVFKTTLRPPAVVFLLLVLPWRRFPAKLFLMLDSTQSETVAELAKQAFEHSPCLLEATTKHWLTQCHGDVRDPVFMLRLALLASLIQGSTSTTESLHSRHARRSRSRPHTRPISIADLATLHLPTNVPAWQQQVQRLVKPEKEEEPQTKEDNAS